MVNWDSVTGKLGIGEIGPWLREHGLPRRNASEAHVISNSDGYPLTILHALSPTTLPTYQLPTYQSTNLPIYQLLVLGCKVHIRRLQLGIAQEARLWLDEK